MFTLSDVSWNPLTSGLFTSDDGGASERSRHGKTTSVSNSWCSEAQRCMVVSRRATSCGGAVGMAARKSSADKRPSCGNSLTASSHNSRPMTSVPNQSGSSITSSSASFFRNTTWHTHTYNDRQFTRRGRKLKLYTPTLRQSLRQSPRTFTKTSLQEVDKINLNRSSGIKPIIANKQTHLYWMSVSF